MPVTIPKRCRDLERSDSLIKFISVIVFLAVAFYIGYSFLANRNDVLRTVTATDIEMRDSIMTEGWAVRDEKTVASAAGNASVTASEGEKVAAGAQIAISYNNASSLERAEEIRELTLQLSKLRELQSSKSEQRSAKDSVMALSGAVHSGDLSNLDSILLDLGVYVTGGTDLSADNLDGTIAAMEARLNALLNSGAGTGAVTAPVSGTFSAAVDGYENVTPSVLTQKLTPDDAAALFANPERVPQGTVGKIVRGIKWYYVTVMPADAATRLSGYNNISVEFSRSYSGTVTMKVENIGMSEGGRCVVVLSCSKYIQDVTAVRGMTAEIIFRASSGIRVPKEAVHLDEDGGTFVYILRGMQAERVDVTILGEEDEYYMAESVGGSLREGDEIITRAANLYDGAVVMD